jgi:alkanesulfonate monooxygenase SsuD/methylene tetrahydromethanopterin reductase-like flavin-dependent oxidoreductase (luciferase family)
VTRVTFGLRRSHPQEDPWTGSASAPSSPRSTPPGRTRHSALQRDLELVEHLDRLGYDEAWIGEHHSAGTEIIASPEIFIAAAAERTRHIKLGTGVTSIAYHNPLWVAERMVLLDHLTRGPHDARLRPRLAAHRLDDAGAHPTDTRELLEVDLDIIMRLLRGETVTEQTSTHNSVNARLHLRPYTEPCFDIAVAAVASPTGPRMAGRHGIGLLSIGATLSKDGFDALAHHWNVVEERRRPLRPDSRPGATGGWSGSCTSPRPASRPTPTSSSASRPGSATSRRRRPSRRWPSRAATPRR